jgi:hypothetical protein
MSKKRTPTKRQKPRKTVPKSECWPAYYAHDDIGYLWAREAIRYGNAEILALYLWQADEIDPRVRRELAEMLNPTSNHFWRLDARYRFHGKPTKLAKRWKPLFNETIVNLAKLLSGVDPLDPRCPRTLAEMLDPESRHPLRLDFKQRSRGRPALGSPPNDWLHLVPAPIEIDPATLLVRRAEERVRGAKKSGTKVPLKQLHDGTSRATFFRRRQLLRNRNKTAVRLKARSTK